MRLSKHRQPKRIARHSLLVAAAELDLLPGSSPNKKTLEAGRPGQGELRSRGRKDCSMKNNSPPSAADSPRARRERLLGGDPRLRRGCELKLRRDPIAGRQCPGCGSLNVIEADAKPPHW